MGKTINADGRADGLRIDFAKKPETKADKEKRNRLILSVSILVFILMLALGWANFRTGKLFNVPERITYRNVVYQTEGEITTSEGLIRTGDKLDKHEVFVRKATPGSFVRIPVHKIYIKAGEDYIVYVLKESK